MINILGLQIAFLIEDKRKNVMHKLEDESMKLLDFIYSFSDFPFIMDAGSETSMNKHILPLINYIEQILECLIMYDYQEPSNQSPKTNKNIENINASVSNIRRNV